MGTKREKGGGESKRDDVRYRWRKCVLEGQKGVDKENNRSEYEA